MEQINPRKGQIEVSKPQGMKDIVCIVIAVGIQHNKRYPHSTNSNITFN